MTTAIERKMTAGMTREAATAEFNAQIEVRDSMFAKIEREHKAYKSRNRQRKQDEAYRRDLRTHPYIINGVAVRVEC